MCVVKLNRSEYDGWRRDSRRARDAFADRRLPQSRGLGEHRQSRSDEAALAEDTRSTKLGAGGVVAVRMSW